MQRYAAGRKALGICDVCGFSYKLRQLRILTVNERQTGLRACPECWESDHPQYKVGKLPVVDPEVLRDPRSDRGEYAASRALILPVRGQVGRGLIGRVTVSTS